MLSPCHSNEKAAGGRSAIHRPAVVAVVGNPNTGKTTLFNVLTGLRQHTGNYPGVTVEKKIGQMALPGRRGSSPAGCAEVDLIDLPGAYSLSACSPDEMVVVDVLLGKEGGQVEHRGPDAVLVVADAAHLERNLFLVTQVLECGRPVVLALNMIDVARSAGLRFNARLLAKELGCQVVPISATRRRGIRRLRAAVERAIGPTANAVGGPGDNVVAMPAPIEQAVGTLENLVAEAQGTSDAGRRPIHRVEALRGLLDRHGPAERRLRDRLTDRFAGRLDEIRAEIAAAGIDLDLAEPGARYDRISQIVQRCVRRVRGERAAPTGSSRSDRIDAVLLHPVGGVAVFAVVMGLMFQAIFAGAGPLMNGVDGLFSALAGWAGSALGGGWFSSLVRDGLIAGVGAVLVFLPQVMLLFAILAVLEDCGYMARAAFVMDRVLRRCGLSGRSFVPMLACFACAVPGILACRVIDNRRDRIVTMLVSPLMSCSARLPVYVLLISAFIPNGRLLGGLVGGQGLTLLGLYLLGVVLAVPIAWIFRGTLLRGRSADLLMEVPPFRWPSLRVVLLQTFHHGRDFLARAGTIILLVTLIVWALTYFPHSAEIARRHEAQRFAARATLAGPVQADAIERIDHDEAGEYVRQSLLGRAGRVIEPVVRPLGWDWRIGTAVLASFPARELILSSMGTIFNLGQNAGDANGSGGGSQNSTGSVQLRKVLASEMSPLAGIGLIVFVALCCQCAATLAAIKRETQSWRWPILTFSYLTLLAYLATLLVVQGGRALGFS